MRLRGFADSPVELCVYEDQVTWITHRPYFVYRKEDRQSVRYAEIRRLVVRQGPHFATLALEAAGGRTISISLARPEAVAQAGRLVSERIYRTHVAELGLARDDHPALREALVALHERGLLTDDYFHAQQQALN